MNLLTGTTGNTFPFDFEEQKHEQIPYEKELSKHRLRPDCLRT